MNLLQKLLPIILIPFCFLSLSKSKKIEIIYVTQKPLKEVVITSNILYSKITRTATTYIPYEKLHTSKDGSHLTMAGGKRINPKDCYKKYIAISRDLKWLYPFGTLVEIENAGEFSGVYEVQDLKGEGFTHQIDILVPEKMYNKQSYKVSMTIIKKGNGKYFKKVV